MNTFLIFIIIYSCAITIYEGAPIDDRSAASETFSVKDYRENENGEGNYSFDFQTSNGIHQGQTGRVIPLASTTANEGERNELEVRGSYSYLSPEGIRVTINYIADKNGFHPETVHFHVPIPDGADAFGGEEEQVAIRQKIAPSALASLTGAGLG